MSEILLTDPRGEKSKLLQMLMNILMVEDRESDVLRLVSIDDNMLFFIKKHAEISRITLRLPQ